jgi:hypothetical protein
MRADDEGNFYLTAYDTTDEDGDDEYIETGEVVLNGLMELVENDFERVGAAGMARIAYHSAQEAIIETVNSDDENSVEHVPNTNIVKVNFGKTQ